MSPDSEYILLIMYATKLEIDLCNFPAIWAVLAILLDTQSKELQYVKNLQQVVDDYYDKCPTEVMSRLEHQITDIMNAMYDSVTNDNFDSISDDTDRVSGAVDNAYDNDNDQMPYDNDNDQIPMTMIMIKCPMTMTMIKCPMTMIVIKCPMNMKMIMILPQ